jgi:hypothetical protein
MSQHNQTSKLHGLVSRANHLPALSKRVQGQFPKHLLVGVSFGDQITMHFHTAGRDAIWEIPVIDAALNERLVNGLAPDDALQLGLQFSRQRSKIESSEMERAKMEASHA